MIRLYNDDDLWNAVGQKRRLLAVFFAALGVWLLAAAGCATWYAMLPYEDPMLPWVIVIVCVIVVGICIALFDFVAGEAIRLLLGR